MSTKLQKIDYAIYHNPNLIPTLLKDCSIKKGMIYSRLRRAVPRRVGIEFECMGNPASTYKYGWHKSISDAKQLKDEFHLRDYSQDSGIARSEAEYERNFKKVTSTKKMDASVNEMRVSIQDYRQLVGLADILKLFSESCRKPIGGGIHIHIDFHQYSLDQTRAIARKYITAHLDEVEQIFPKYDGTYNKREVGDHRKGTYVNLSYHGTIEFRIAPLTFDYETLIKWIIDCNKFVTKVIHECHLLTDEEINKRSLEKLKLKNPSSDVRVDLGDGSSRTAELRLTDEEIAYLSRLVSESINRNYPGYNEVRALDDDHPEDNVPEADDPDDYHEPEIDRLSVEDEMHTLRNNMADLAAMPDEVSYQEYRRRNDAYQQLSNRYFELRNISRYTNLNSNSSDGYYTHYYNSGVFDL